MCAFPSQLDVTSNTWRGPNSQTLHAAEIKFHARRRGGGGGEFVVGLTVGSRMRDEEEEGEKKMTSLRFCWFLNVDMQERSELLREQARIIRQNGTS